MSERKLRNAVVETARALVVAGLNTGSAGNVSARLPGAFLITPTGVDYATLEPGGLVEVGMDGSVAPGQLKPSSEWRFHRDILAAREEVGAVIHVHSPYATALACVRSEIPPFHYMVAVTGGTSVRCAAYATFGTQELSDHALAALEGRRACLLANHGMIALGDDLDAALKLAIEVESLAQQYSIALQAGGPVLLDEEEMSRVLEKFKTYGKQGD